MYCNFSLVNEEFLDKFSPNVSEIIKNNLYSVYKKCGHKNSRKLPMNQYFSSIHIKYKFVYSYCPKCKNTVFFVIPFKKSSLHELKYCTSCGTSNISYRYLTGFNKAEYLTLASNLLLQMQEHDPYFYLNQQITVLINSIMEVYLRDAGILNTQFVNVRSSLFEKFARECHNDFQNPAKANIRLKRDLSINLKKEIGNNRYNILDELSAYRNVIVHNSGICDEQFINKNIDNYSLHDIIKISIDKIKIYLNTLNETVLIFDEIYKNIIEQQIIHDLEYKILTQSKDAFPIFIFPH